MSDQYSLYWKLNADSSNFNKNVSSAQKSLSGLQGAFQKLQKFTVAGIVGTAGLKAIRELKKVIDETTAAYRTQINAENALSVALKNNIKTSELSAKAMKDYASALQSASNYGDEELLPMISKLIASGRTEAEAMKIMSAAVDLAAGANMSLDSAVEQLNGTINGNVGRLGRQNAELKSLTAEELASGKAVDIIAKKYEGMAKKTQDSSKLLKNAIGDYKELAGETFEKALSPMRKYFAELLQNHVKAIKAAKALRDAEKGVFYEEDAGKLQEQYDIVKAQIEDYRKKIRQVREEQHARGGRTENFAMDMFNVQQWQSAIDSLSPRLQELFEKITDIKKKEKELADAEAEAIKQAKAEEAVKNLLDLQNEYLDAIKAQEKAWKDSEAVTGEAVSLEEKRTFYQNKLLEIITASNDEINAGTQYYQNQMSIINALTQQIEAQGDATEKFSEWDEKLLKQRRDSLDETSVVYHKLTQLMIEEEYEKTLATEENEEERKKITAYYANMQIAENERFENVKRKQTKETLKKVTEYMSASLNVLKRMLSTALNAVKSAFSTLKSLVNMNLSDSLDTLLEFEDKILTFFVETLPKLPFYVSSVLQSIRALLDNLSANINVGQLTQIFSDIIQNVVQELPNIIIKITNIATTIITALADALIENLPTIAEGLATMREQVIPKIEEMLGKLIEAFGGILETLLPEAIKFILEFIFMIAKKLPSLVSAIIEALPEVITAILEEIPKFFEEDFPTIVAEFIKLVPTLVKVALEIVVELIKHFPEIVVSLIAGLVKAFAETNWIQVVKDIFTAFIDAIKSFFGIHSPSTVFAEIGKYLIEGLWQGISDLWNWLETNVLGFFGNLWESIKSVFSNVGSWFKNTFQTASKYIKDAFSGLGSWFSGIWEDIKNAFSGAKQWFSDLFSDIADNIGDLLGTKINVTTSSSGTSTERRVGSPVVKAYASGTETALRGLALVGEAGPELVRFNGGEQVLNAKNTQKAINGMNKGGNIFNVTFNNLQDTTAFQMMSQLKQYQKNLAFNGVL